MFRIITVGVIVAMLGGCGSQEVPVESPQLTESKIKAHEVLTVASAEIQVHLEAGLAPQSYSPDITVEQLVNPMKIVNMVTMDVKPPRPESLLISLHAWRTQRSPRHPIVIRGKVIMDKETVGTFAELLNTRGTKRMELTTVDVSALASKDVDSLLIQAEAELLILPEGTDPATIDPLTVTTSPSQIGVKRSNPVRINFLSEE